MLGNDPDKLTATSLRTVVQVTAPVDGFVGDLAITRGMFLPASTRALTILNTGAQYAEFYVFEKDMPGIRPGQVIRFHLLNEDEETYAARVLLTGKQIDPEHKTIPIHARLEHASDAARFSPGMYIEGFIETSVDSAAALPLTAVVETEGKYFALRVEREDQGTLWLRQVEVVVGARDSAFAEIRNTGDFKPGDTFLTKGAYTLIQ
jgi:cobalt-zinc-cadmium efflux system membrane fusion protein